MLHSKLKRSFKEKGFFFYFSLSLGLIVVIFVVYLALHLLFSPRLVQTCALVDEFPEAYLLYDGLTLEMDGSPAEIFFLSDGFTPPQDSDQARDGRVRSVGKSFGIAFERWQLTGIKLQLGLLANPGNTGITLLLNDGQVSTLKLEAGSHMYSFDLPDELLREGENTATFTITGDAEPGALIDFLRIGTSSAAEQNEPMVDERLIEGKKTRVVGNKGPWEMNCHQEIQTGSHLSFGLGHDQVESGKSPGTLGILVKGASSGKVIKWEGAYPVGNGQKTELDLNGLGNELVLISFSIVPASQSDDWLYLADPMILSPEVGAGTKSAYHPLVMKKSPPRTIVVIIEDAMRRDLLPIYGNHIVQTPNLDSITKSALVFDNAYSSGPITQIVFFGMFTGKYAPNIRKFNLAAYKDIPTLAGTLTRNEWETSYFSSNPQTSSKGGLSLGYKDIYELYNLDEGKLKYSAEDYLPWLSQWLAKVPQQKDAFITLHLMDTHSPYAVPPEDFLLYFEKMDEIQKSMPWIVKNLGQNDLQQMQSDIAMLFASVTYFDRVLPGITGMISEFRDPGNTVYIFLSDHGDELLDHGTMGHGATLYQEVIHVPLIVWGSGVKARRSAQFVSNMDLMPTILDLAGIKPPEGMDGISFAPQMNGNTGMEKRIIISTMQKGSYSVLSAIDGHFKLIYQNSSYALYDLILDPLETTDVSSQYPLEFAYLRGKLWEWCQRNWNGTSGEEANQQNLSKRENEILKGLGYIQ